MENNIEYVDEGKYLIRRFHGVFNKDELLESWKHLVENTLQEKSYDGILNDFCDAQIKMEINDLEYLMDFFRQNMSIFQNLKLAVVMTSPDNIIFPLFAKKTSPFNIAAFTTLNAAQKWILDE